MACRLEGGDEKSLLLADAFAILGYCSKPPSLEASLNKKRQA